MTSDGVRPPRGEVFRYEGFAADAERGLLTCRYSLDGRAFSERVSLTPGGRKALASIRSKKTAFLEARLAKLSDADRGAVHAALDILERLAEDE